MPMN
jgi:hypothetical protein